MTSSRLVSGMNCGMKLNASKIKTMWNNLGNPVFDGVGLAGFKSMANAFILTWLLASFLSPTDFPVFSFIQWVGIVGLGSSD